MHWRSVVVGVVSIASVFGVGRDPAYARSKELRPPQAGKITQAQRQAAAVRAEAGGFALPAAGIAAMSPGAVPHYFSHPNYANSPRIHKFVDSLPGLTSAGRTTSDSTFLSRSPTRSRIPAPTTTRSRWSSTASRCTRTCRATRLRGYVQLATCASPAREHVRSTIRTLTRFADTVLPRRHSRSSPSTSPHYLGPLISRTKDRPVRILFRNLLPTGQGGDLFIPVDTTVMGSGMGPRDGRDGGDGPAEPHVRDRARSRTAATRRTGPRCTCTAASRPWISDGTPHQWITPAGDTPPIPKGVSVSNVPDMPDPGPGAHDLLLHQPAERAADVLPRPRLGNHAPECLRRRGGGAT